MLLDDWPRQRESQVISRRRFFLTAGGALVATTFHEACLTATNPAQPGDARISARPRAHVSTSLKSGPLGLVDGERDGVIQMPSEAVEDNRPLLVFLHGATQNGALMLRRIGQAADHAGVVVLAPDSRGETWDAIRDTFGRDVAFLNRAIEQVFERAAIDPARIAIGGFSDGASYALSLGIANGDLFSHVLACSPGFTISTAPQGHPRFFVSHGTSDQILPIDQCSRIIVPRLKAMGYDVTYREFDGRHEVPPAVAKDAMQWLASAPASV